MTIGNLQAKPNGAGRAVGLLLLGTLISLLAGACSAGDDEIVAGPRDLGHIHDLAFDDNGALLVASHLGLYRIDDVDRAMLIGGARHDLMSMTRLDSGDLIASGHPDLRADEYRREGLPPHFGLAESPDLGESWTVADGLGENDFHVLVPTEDGIYAAEATTSSIWLLAADGEWDQRGSLEARDLAVDPDDPERQIAVDFDGGVWTSDDAARTWRPVPDAPALVEVEWIANGQLYGVDDPGTIWANPDRDGQWLAAASGPAEPETLLVVDETIWWVTTHGGRIFSTENAGRNWGDVYIPPTEP